MSATPATGDLGGVTFTAKAEGEAGNGIVIEFVDPDQADQGLQINVDTDNRKITVSWQLIAMVILQAMSIQLFQDQRSF